MSDYKVYQNIDWLSYTSMKRFEELGWDYERTWEITNSGMNGYEYKALDSESGLMALFSDKRPDMGTHIIMSGDTRQFYRAVGMTDSELAAMALERGNGKVSRIDIAITSHPLSVCMAQQFGGRHQQIAYNTGKCLTRMRKNTGYTNEGIQRSFYIGSGGKNNQYRGYDKANQFHGVKGFLERYELQGNKKTASTIARMVAKGTDMGLIMNRYIKFDHPVWEEIVGSEKATVTHLPEKDETDTIAWLRNVAASALAKQAILYRDTLDEKTGNKKDPYNVIEWFNAVVLQKISEIDRNTS